MKDVRDSMKKRDRQLVVHLTQPELLANTSVADPTFYFTNFLPEKDRMQYPAHVVI